MTIRPRDWRKLNNPTFKIATYLHARLLEILRQKSISLKAQGVDFPVPPYTAALKSFRTSTSLEWLASSSCRKQRGGKEFREFIDYKTSMTTHEDPR